MTYRRFAILAATLAAAVLGAWVLLRDDDPGRRTATLRGAVGPARLLAQMRAEGGVGDAGAPGDDAAAPRVRLRHLAPEAPGPAAPQRLGPVALAPDGAFAIDLPPGRWEVLLEGKRRFADGTFRIDTAPLGVVDLADGDTLVRSWQLDAWVRGRLRGRVLVNGRPWADGQVRLLGALAGEEGAVRHADDPAQTDAKGALDVLVRPGTYRLVVRGIDAVSQSWWSLPADEEILVRAGATVEQTFHLACTPLRLWLRGQGGAPAAGALVALRAPRLPDGLRAVAGPTGMVFFARVPAGETLVQVLPQSLHAAAATTWLLGETAAQTRAWEDALVTAAALELAGSESPAEREIALPPAAGY